MKMQKVFTSSFVALGFSVVLSPAMASNVSLTFDVPTANTSETMAVYGFSGGDVSSAAVVGGQLILGSAAGGQHSLDLGAFAGDLTIQYDTTTAGLAGNVNTGFRVGDNVIVFHPGYQFGAFRIDGVQGNMSMGFTPSASVFSHVKLGISASGSVSIDIANSGDRFTYLWQDSNYTPGTTVLGLSVGGAGSAVFDNVNVSTVPEPATSVMMVFGLLAAGGLARRQMQR